MFDGRIELRAGLRVLCLGGRKQESLVRELVDHRDPTGSGMGREGSPGPVLKEKTLTGRESWRKVGSGAAEKGALPEAGRVGGKGGSHSAGSSFFSAPSKFKSAASQKEVSGAMAQTANQRGAP